MHCEHQWQADMNERPKRIDADIRIEITGEDKPTKYEKRRERWSAVGLAAVVIGVLAVIVCCAAPSFSKLSLAAGITFIVCFIVFLFSLNGASSTGRDEPSGFFPWWF